jgi:PAS domain S-box-containing protein
VSARLASPARILIVEDEGLIALDIERSLQDLGYEVVGRVDSSTDALRCAAANRPDLVLMDVHIKGELDGIETAALLRREHDVAIAYLTAFGDVATVERTKATAPGGLLLKPFKPADLYSLVEIELYRTQVVRMQRSIRERTEVLATILRSIGDAVIATDRDLAVTFMNGFAEGLTGWPLGDARGHAAGEVLPLQDEESGASLAALLIETMWGRMPCHIPAATVVTRAGELRHVRVSVAPTLHADELVGAVIVFSDITVERKIARQLEVTERMALLGRHSAALAHDMKNALAVVGANLHYARENTAAESDVRDAIGDAATGVARLEQIVARLRLFGGESCEGGSVDLEDVLQWALGATERQWKTWARIAINLQRLPHVAGDDARVGQVLVELLGRAATAVADSERDRNEIRIVGRRDPDGRAALTIFDTGRAMGGGLPTVVTALVAELGGDVCVDPRIGGGNEVTLRLPAARTIPLDPTRRRDAATAERHRGKVLVVDDDDLVGQVVARVLAQEHDVIAVHSAREAVELFESGQRFDVVIADVVMPGQDGIELLDDVRARFPEAHAGFMFLTGGGLDAKAARALARRPEPSLEKPFDPVELRALVATLVQHRPR